MDRLLGLYGGTFDPPHKAHLKLARAFLKSFKGARLVVTPCFVPPHKALAEGGASADDRLAMTRLCFEGVAGEADVAGEAEEASVAREASVAEKAGEAEEAGVAGVTVSDCELQSGGTSYTYLTVRKLQKLYPEYKICLLMGLDNLLIMEKWREYKFLLENCVIAAALRGDEPARPAIERLREKYGADIRVLKFEKSPLSSTSVRRAVGLGLPIDRAVTEKVAEYIEEKGLYRDTPVEIPTEEILRYIQRLSPRRLRHTFGVEKACVMLAKTHFPRLDLRLVSAAALLHDCTKECDAAAQAAAAAEYGVAFDPIEAANIKLQHAVTGAAVAKYRFGLPEAADAIRCHTTAAADMGPLAKVLYIADYIEENRADELCVSVRREYFKNLKADEKTALDKTVLFALDKSLKVLSKELKEIHPHTIEARTYIKESLANEGYCGGTEQ